MTPTIFGWCTDGHHAACPHHAPGQATPLICTCHCHQEDTP